MSGTGTPRLYFDDPWLVSFEARVVGHGAWQGQPSVLLERTGFYPEAGGQMADRGVLAGAPVVDVQVDDADLVHHVLAPGAALPAVGEVVRGEIDRARRRVHMALHTGQHMLSRGLLDEAGAETVSSRLGETACTIDLDKEAIPEGEIARAEAVVNAVVDDDVKIRAFFPAPAELAALPLRRRPKVDENIRVVEIGAFDVSPCGGTHCTSSAQVGLVRVTGVERYKGKVRVTFVAGGRAREALGAESGLLRALAREMTCGPEGVPVAVQKLRDELQAARLSLGQARAKLAERLAEELVAGARAAGSPVVVAAVGDGDVEMLRALAKRITAEPGGVAILAAREGDAQKVLVARAPDATLDCGAWLKQVAQAAGGRGGGGKDRAEGRVPLEADWVALAAAHRTW
jgi:alanyl-tRNA synthetase